MPTLLGPDPSTVASQLGPVVPQAVPVAQQKIPRSDRIEVSIDYPLYSCLAHNSDSVSLFPLLFSNSSFIHNSHNINGNNFYNINHDGIMFYMH